eukprot:TRINITY_DN4208_c1_g1_i1.p1 TRINITY_DN4208_c1_g1~~TRINITY_DN4208_c1_g1_i1.p1  ORF type:complete len:1010 (-),score=193.29 TRINITY_DN4208_c1_g1_i1:196-3195(-)
MPARIGDVGASRYEEDYRADRALMAALDARTEIPHLLVELRSLGYVEICGKNIGGVYDRLEKWFAENWGCEFMTTEFKKVKDPNAYEYDAIGAIEGFVIRCVALEDWNRLCDSSFDWQPNELICKCMPFCGKKTVTVFKNRGSSGENNMGKLTMQLINFMTNTCGWGLHLCNGTNLGFYGQIREQQIKFKAPHPLNLIAPHLMIELRQAGWIEINGADTDGIYGKLESWLKDTWRAKTVKTDPDYCDGKFSCKVFKKRGFEGENNMGMRTMEIVDFMVKQCAWTMITCNGGNYGKHGDIREQQMVFRNDGHVQHGEDHFMVELRDIGYVEVNGLSSSPEVEACIDRFLKQCWKCTDYKSGFFESSEKYCDRKYTTPETLYYKQGLTNNIGKLTIELAMSMAKHGWMLMLCNGGHTSTMKDYAGIGKIWDGETIAEVNGGIKREQQIKFTKAREGDKPDEPLLMIELRTVPKNPPNITAPEWDPFRMKMETARLQREEQKKLRDWVATCPYEGLIEINGFNTNGVYQRLNDFIRTYMKGQYVGPTEYCDCLFTCKAFRQKMSTSEEFWDGYYSGECNIGKYTMRLCDFLVDHLGEWDLIVCNGNAAERGWKFGSLTTLTAREQQLVFRHRSAGRAVFMAKAVEDVPLGRPPLSSPAYWKEGSREGSAKHEIVVATGDELQWMQDLLDNTYIKKVTRDRRGGKLAHRFKVVAAVRSENGKLWDAFAQRRELVAQQVAARPAGVTCKYWVTGSCKYGETCKFVHGPTASVIRPKSMDASPGLAQRCVLDDGSNPSNEAVFMHGTNPTSAVTILRTDLKIDLAGASAGTMFGPGAYLAEASTKADEYAQDDKDGTYKGLYAMVICRAVVGTPYVVEKPGNYARFVTSGDFDCVLGDREKAVGTFREFIFFHEEAIYPEYAVFYRREFNSPAGGTSDSAADVPAAAAAAADVPQGTPGMRDGHWQVRVPEDLVSAKFKMQCGDKAVDVSVPDACRLGSILTLTF